MGRRGFGGGGGRRSGGGGLFGGGRRSMSSGSRGGGLFGRSAPKTKKQSRKPAKSSQLMKRKPTSVAKPAPSAGAGANATPGGGGMFSGLASTLMTGALFGMGSSIGHRAVDAVAGPRQVEHVHSGGEQPEGQYEAKEMQGESSMQEQQAPKQQPCQNEMLAFTQCLQNNAQNTGLCDMQWQDMTKCQQTVSDEVFL